MEDSYKGMDSDIDKELNSKEGLVTEYEEGACYSIDQILINLIDEFLDYQIDNINVTLYNLYNVENQYMWIITDIFYQKKSQLYLLN